MPRRKAGTPEAAKAYTAPPPGGYQDLCGTCLRPIEADGRCADCGGWPGAVWLVNRETGARLRDPLFNRFAWEPRRPKRACPTGGGPITVDGGCDACQDQVGPSLIHPADSPVKGCWVEAGGEGPFPIKRCSPEEARRNIHEIMDMLAHGQIGASSIEQASARFTRQHETEDVP